MKISMIMLVLTLLVSIFITGCLSSSTDPISGTYCYFTLDDGSVVCRNVGDTRCSDWDGGSTGGKTIVSSQETAYCY